MALSYNGQGMHSGTGLWNCPRVPQYSKETQEMLKLMMQESRLTNFQQRQITSQLKKGGTLPLTCNPTSSAPLAIPKPRITIPAASSARPQKRSAAMCCSSDNYTRERFRPSATRDLEKEKQRLQDLFYMGKEQLRATHTQSHTDAAEKEGEKETDRFKEILEEIEERKRFLDEMTTLGRGKDYHSIISTEISQRIRELELITSAHAVELKDEKQKAEELLSASENSTLL